MGNHSSSSRPSKNFKARPASARATGDFGDQPKVRPGTLDTCAQLEILYNEIVSRKEVQEELQQVFQDLRILVVGRSGSGKSTLIRLIVGEEGPKCVRNGKAGEQDIRAEWRYSDPELPLIFHDSNGTDVKGNIRLEAIKNFLDEHQSSADFKQRIHLVWYVFSAMDNRFLDDGGILELVSTYRGLPLLLVMTHNDWENGFTRHVEGRPLDELLRRIRDPEKRAKVRDEMVKLGNDVKFEENKNIIQKVDKDGLIQVTQRTKNLFGKKAQKTWIACQAADMNEKLEMSAKLILRKKRAQVFATSALGALPGVHQVQLGVMFLGISRSLCKVWKVPEAMEKALYWEIMTEENTVVRNMFVIVAASLGLGASVALTLVTGGIGSVAVVGVLAGYAFAQIKGTSSLVTAYSLLVLGAILYARSSSGVNGWDSTLTVADFSKHCRDFTDSPLAQDIQDLIKKYSSAWETTIHSKTQSQRLKSDLVKVFGEIVLGEIEL